MEVAAAWAGSSRSFSCTAFGLDLTYRSLAAVLKYDSLIPAVRAEDGAFEKGYNCTEAALVAQIRKSVAPKLEPGQPFKTIECAIIDIADDIAYSTCDLEDSLHAGFVSPLSLAHSLMNDEAVKAAVLRKTNAALQREGYEAVDDASELLAVLVRVFAIDLPVSVERLLAARPQQLSSLDGLVPNLEAWHLDEKFSDTLARTQFTAERVGKLISEIKLAPNRQFPQLSGVTMSRDGLLQVEVLKHLNYELMIRSPRLTVVEYRGKDVVTAIFDALCKSQGSLLPSSWRPRYSEAAAMGSATCAGSSVITSRA